MSRIACGLLTAVLGTFAVHPVHSQAPLPGISYYERLESPELSPGIVTLHALGRDFELVLERNDALLNGLPAAQRSAASDIELWKGTLAGLPDSLVRLTRRKGPLSGMIWDGVDLYVIEPYRTASPRLVAPSAEDAGDTIVYLASDSRSSFSDLMVPRTSQPQALAKSRAEPLSAAAVPSTALEIDVGLIADPEYVLFAANSLGSDAVTELLSIANVLDGIFRPQVGVRIRLAELVVLDAEPDPFTSADPSTLMGELERYKSSNSALASLGLAHLVTGRDLQESGDKELIGIANVGSLCERARSVSLIQGTFGTAQSALIAAHEIGHNFGAPHDAEPGSVCAAAPHGFVMDASFSESKEFSQCSIDQMVNRIRTATCVRPVPLSDLSVTSNASRTNVLTGWPYEVSLFIENVGSEDVLGIDVLVETSTEAVLQTPQFPDSEGLHCEQNLQSKTCTLDILRSGDSAVVKLRLTAVQAGTVTTMASISALNDFDPSNNVTSFELEAIPAVKFRTLSLEKSTEVARPGQGVDVAVTIVNEGVIDATGAWMRINLPSFLELDSATLPQGGSCDNDWSSSWRCAIGTLPVQQPQVVNLRLRTLELDLNYGSVTGGFLGLSLGASEPSASNGAVTTTIDATRVFADTDLTVDSPRSGTSGEIAVFSFAVQNLGPDSVPSMRLQFSNAGIVIEDLQSQGATCAIEGASNSVRCEINSTAPGETRTVSIRGPALKVGAYPVAYSLSVDAYSVDGAHFEEAYSWAVLSSPAPPPSPPPPEPSSPAGSGGGGGGPFDPISLLWVLAAGALRAESRQRRHFRYT